MLSDLRLNIYIYISKELFNALTLMAGSQYTLERALRLEVHTK